MSPDQHLPSLTPSPPAAACLVSGPTAVCGPQNLLESPGSLSPPKLGAWGESREGTMVLAVALSEQKLSRGPS